jgi:hypothetical protein
MSSVDVVRNTEQLYNSTISFTILSMCGVVCCGVDECLGGYVGEETIV